MSIASTRQSRSDDVLATRDGLGEHHRQRVGCTHLHEVWRYALAGPTTQHGERARDVPAPADLEHRSIEQRLDQCLACAARCDVAKYRVEWEAVRLPERDHDAVVGRDRLQLEVERHAELLAQREAPRPIDAPSEGRVQDELHTTRLVEEALGDDEVLAGQSAEGAARHGEIGDRLLGRAQRHRGLGSEPRRDRVNVVGREACVDVATQRAHLVGQLACACGSLAEPERDVRRLTACILDDDLAGLDAPDLPRRVAELEDVTGRAVDREVLVDRADLRLLGPLHDGVVVVVGNGAARRDRGEPCRASRLDDAANAVAMQVRTDAAAAIRHAFAEHRHHLLELLVAEVGVRRRVADQRGKLGLGQILGGADRDDLLCEDVERCLADRDLVEVAASHAAHERRTLEQLVARQCEQATLRRAANLVARATDALDQRGDRAG
jgi:hypothetical protein